VPRKKKSAKSSVKYPEAIESVNPLDGLMLHEDVASGVSPESKTIAPQARHHIAPAYSDSAHGIYLYQNNCLAVLDAIAAKYPEGRFDMIFADPPYFLSNGGITCHAGKMVAVHKGDWDKSRGPEWNHEFNTEWLKRCQRVLKPNGTIWVSGTHHVIFSVGFAMQQLGFKILNDIAWEKPNPPPNLSCRYFTHSTETILWAAKSEKSKHLFNYQEMRKVTGKQMKTVWRKEEFSTRIDADLRGLEEKTNSDSEKISDNSCQSVSKEFSPIWTMTAPGGDEKKFGKHPTQKPVALIERCIRASTKEGDCVLDPFLGGGTTAVAALRTKRHCVGIDLDKAHIELAAKRGDREIVLIWLREFRVRVEINVTRVASSLWLDSEPASSTRRSGHRPDATQNDLDLFPSLIDRSAQMPDKPEIQAEQIFHETKFVFLSCARVSETSVVHTTVDVNIQEAWTHAPKKTKCETTHIVKCETQIYRVAKEV
jgi:site-specific DNA-methyltransferase (adenine-specific)